MQLQQSFQQKLHKVNMYEKCKFTKKDTVYKKGEKCAFKTSDSATKSETKYDSHQQYMISCMQNAKLLKTKCVMIMRKKQSIVYFFYCCCYYFSK